MSVLEDLQAFEQRISSRIAELRPLVDEYEQLQQVADRLGFDVRQATAPQRGRKPARQRAAGAKSPDARSSGSRQRRRPGGRTSAGQVGAGTKAVGADRRARVLELIQQRPGISVPDISRELGVDPPPLYRTVRRLQADGVIKKEGKSLTPA